MLLADRLQTGFFSRYPYAVVFIIIHKNLLYFYPIRPSQPSVAEGQKPRMPPPGSISLDGTHVVVAAVPSLPRASELPQPEPIPNKYSFSIRTASATSQGSQTASLISWCHFHILFIYKIRFGFSIFFGEFPSFSASSFSFSILMAYVAVGWVVRATYRD